MNKRPTGRVLFKVAIVSDTHVNEKEDFSASPYPANAEANPRARHALAQLDACGAAFIVHLGDMINPVPELPSYVDAVRNFHALTRDLATPIHLVPGNHDIGDKAVSWMPAGMVNGEYIALYRRHFGKDYYAFAHEECHFIVINAPLINSGDPAEKEQAEWLETYLAEHAGRRMFLFTHYPIFITRSDEPESYDNIGEPGRSWLLALIRKYRPEALFAAHVHNFWYDVVGDTECYVTPSTCFVRHDYSEMYRIDGGDQHGRNDTAKLGFLTLDVHERGHVAHYHRSYGAKLAGGAARPGRLGPRPHVKTSPLAHVYVDMRHAWAEEMVVAPSGAVDEFQRKKARNDYPLMALWEMGIRGLRVPIQDLIDPTTRRRMQLMHDVGHVFQVYLYGVPDVETTAILQANAGLVAKMELVLGWDDVRALSGEMESLKTRLGLKTILSRVNRKDGAKHAGGRFNHLISHGFTIAEIDELVAFAGANPGLVDGFQFTIQRSASPWSASRTLCEFSRATGCHAVLYVKSTEASPAQTFDDEAANAERFAAAAMSGTGYRIDVVLDTFDDADRGYFARLGLVDRRYNPRTGSRLLSAMAAHLSSGAWEAAETEEPLLVDRASGKRLSIDDLREFAGQETAYPPKRETKAVQAGPSPSRA